jgi:hypothetical protein
MNEEQSKVVEEPRDLRAKIENWVASQQGRQRIEKALGDSKRMVEPFKAAKQLDPAILREPMTS